MRLPRKNAWLIYTLAGIGIFLYYPTYLPLIAIAVVMAILLTDSLSEKEEAKDEPKQ